MKIFTTLSLSEAIKLTGEIVAGLPRDIDNKIYVFCESKATLSFEKQIAKLIGGSFNTEVTSFSRYVSKNVRVDKFVNKAQSSLIVRKLMTDNESLFNRLKPQAVSVPNDVYGLISQLKSALVKPSDLSEILKSESGAFGAKLADVYTAYSLYEKYLNDNGLTDESGFLSLMTDALKKDKSLKGAKVIIAGIQSFTAQTLKIVKTLASLSDVDFITVSSNRPGYTNESINKISGAFLNAEVIVSEFDESYEQNALSKWLFEPCESVITGRYSDKVKISESKTVDEECEKIAKRIRYEVVNNGYRYKDFSVITSNPDLLAPKIKESFAKYDIPVYADETKTLQDHPVIGLIGALIDVKRFNYAPDKVIKLVRNGLFCSYDESQAFTSYVYDNAVSRKQFKEPFDDLICESVRQKVVLATENFKSKDSAENYVNVVKNALDLLNVYNRAEKFSEGLENFSESVLAEFNKSAINALPEFLDEVSSILQQSKSSLIEFKRCLFGASKAVIVAGVPEYNDTVYLGDFRGGRSRKSRILFCPSFTYDVPSYKSDVALLNDRELIKMDGYKLVIEPKLQIVNDRERENIVVSMTGFTDKLYVSYATVDVNGKPTTRSGLINRIIGIFSDRDKKLGVSVSGADDGAVTEFNYMSEKAGLLYSAKKAEAFCERLQDDTSDVASFYETINDKKNLEKILFKTEKEIFTDGLSYDGKFSATFIETYFSCPYKAFCQNVLKLQEASDGQTKVYEIGNVLHNVMENFIKKYPSGGDEKDVEILASELFDEELKVPLYARYLNKPQYKHIFELIKEEAVKECLKIFRDVNDSSFKPLGAEIEFNEYTPNGLRPLRLKTYDGEVVLRGKIDRADGYFDGKNEYFRIIDYKSGSASADEKMLYSGNKIQLYLYMNVFTDKGFKPAGAHYFKLSDDYSAEGTNGGEYLGRSLSDKEIVGKLDGNFLTSGVSKNLGVRLKNDGEFYPTASLLTEDEFYKYIDYAEKVATLGANEMKKGLFVPSPVEGSCEYCKYKGMCGYDDECGDRTRNVSGASKQSIMNAEADDE